MALAVLDRTDVSATRRGESHPKAGFWALTLGSIGVVYGDIGTSPLYAVRELVLAAVGADNPASEAVILGILSLIIWSLIVVVSVKYIIILLRADNNGEGGTLALMALAHRATASGVVILLGIISGALFYGDAIITPALSVLSAVEGLKILTPAFEPYVVPFALIILFTLFAVQSRGTAKVAAFFGPITLIWFMAIAAAGIWHVSQNPTVLWAFNPIHGASFLASHGLISLITLGAVFLAVTGSEALYADLGHFGRGPIRMAWFSVALPALTINYLRPGRTLVEQSESDRESIFPALSGLGAAAHGRARHCRNRDREPSSNHRRVFIDPAGDPIGAVAATSRFATPLRRCLVRSTCRG